MMPYMDGAATVRALQRLQPGLPFITISGLTDNARISDFAQAANARFLAKPFTTEQVLRTLNEVLGGCPKNPV
jgi:two-component system cell cycle sensor histidine kinase/response regulator CckA